MNFIDLLVLLLIVVNIIRGYRVGSVRQLMSTAGFAISILLVIFLSRMTVYGSDPSSRDTTILFGIAAIAAMILIIAAEYVIRLIKRHLKPITEDRIRMIDGGFGTIVSLLTLMVGLWLGTTVASLMPSGPIQTAVRDSATFGYFDKNYPPATQLLASLDHLITSQPMGPVIANESKIDPSKYIELPERSSFDSTLNKARASIVRVQGLGCGGLVNGTGFVYHHNLIITNAHVVAGVKNPKLYDQNGSHNARVVYFNPDLDVAVLRSDNLAGQPLKLTYDQLSDKSIGLVTGYPGGGPQVDQVIGVTETVQTISPDIYNDKKSRKEVYVLQARLIPGNSGGPVVDAEGRVRGVIFGTSTKNSEVGYALTLPQLEKDLNVAKNASTTISTASCSKI